MDVYNVGIGRRHRKISRFTVRLVDENQQQRQQHYHIIELRYITTYFFFFHEIHFKLKAKRRNKIEKSQQQKYIISKSNNKLLHLLNSMALTVSFHKRDAFV